MPAVFIVTGFRLWIYFLAVFHKWIWIAACKLSVRSLTPTRYCIWSLGVGAVYPTICVNQFGIDFIITFDTFNGVTDILRYQWTFKKLGHMKLIVFCSYDMYYLYIYYLAQGCNNTKSKQQHDSSNTMKSENKVIDRKLSNIEKFCSQIFEAVKKTHVFSSGSFGYAKQVPLFKVFL